MASNASSTNSSQEDVLGKKIAELQQSPIWSAPGIPSDNGDASPQPALTPAQQQAMAMGLGPLTPEAAQRAIVAQASNTPAAPSYNDQTHTISRGDTVEAIARARYGDDWRAGVAVIISANNLRANSLGSPLLTVGNDLTIPDLQRYQDRGIDLSVLAKMGGNIIAGNQRGIDAYNAWQEQQRQQAAAQASANDAYREQQRMAGFAADNQSYASRLATVQPAPPVMVERPIYTAMGDYAGTEYVPVDNTPARDPVGEAIVRTAKAAWNDPAEAGKGVVKSLLDIGPGIVNTAITGTKLAIEGWMAIGNQAGLVSDDTYQTFRDTQPLQMHMFTPSNDAQRFGQYGTDAAMFVAGGVSAWTSAGKVAALRDAQQMATLSADAASAGSTGAVDGAGLGFRLNESGPTPLVARDPVDLAAQRRLNALDGDVGKFRPGEAGVAAEMENYLGGTLARAPAGTSADFVVESGDFAGARMDLKLTPDTFEKADKLNTYFDKTFPKFSESFAGKLADPNGVDLMPFDTRFLTPGNAQKLFDFVGTLPLSSQQKVIYLVH